MADTKINWCDKVWNPWTGCTQVSPGCSNCYAKRMAHRLKGRFGYPADNPFAITVRPERFDEPKHWRKPAHIFVCSMSDFFHRDIVGTTAQTKALGVMRRTPQHTYYLLTKRPENIPDWDWPSNVLIGVSIENQAVLEPRMKALSIVKAKRFISFEPLISNVYPAPFLRAYCASGKPPIDWAIIGCEAISGRPGPDAKKSEWWWDAAHILLNQLSKANVPIWFKQGPRAGNVCTDMSKFPKWAQRRERPE